MDIDISEGSLDHFLVFPAISQLQLRRLECLIREAIVVYFWQSRLLRHSTEFMTPPPDFTLVMTSAFSEVDHPLRNPPSFKLYSTTLLKL